MTTQEKIAVMEESRRSGVYVIAKPKSRNSVLGRKQDTSWKTVTDPQWDWVNYDYELRIAPKPPTIREWKPEEVPLDAWFRPKRGDCSSRITKGLGLSKEFYLQADQWATTTKLFNNYEHSFTPFDPNSWMPCGKEQP